MVDKGYLDRAKSGGAYTFTPLVKREDVKRRHAGRSRGCGVFSGSAASLLLSLLERADLDDEEIRRLRAMIRRLGTEKSK